ncbi:hypothetical protein [Methylobacterium radiodurans]|uniref:Uncharacterized protein n=1 Tax=Methylobacterium radiodurans TaxID=2202828 RepID=A0A2U8VM61_9HYPH|nr:hypothetical protein [Methylobacterium radiodurans]AWN34630.1 hypothetical protein DK427_01825 [Methylobacterium radiodurans]
MSFLLRALLVIGVLSYLALKRGEPGTAAPALPSADAVAAALAAAAPAAIQAGAAALPPETRERVAREALAGLIRRAAQPVPELPEPASRDTLSATDRAPAWRGIEAR